MPVGKLSERQLWGRLPGFPAFLIPNPKMIPSRPAIFSQLGIQPIRPINHHQPMISSCAVAIRHPALFLQLLPALMDAQLVEPPIFRRAEQQMPEEDGHEEDGRGNPDLDTDGL